MDCAFVTVPQSLEPLGVYFEGGESWRAGEPGDSLFLNSKFVHLTKLYPNYAHFSLEGLTSYMLRIWRQAT